MGMANEEAESMNLRVGEWVEIRSAQDILSTLDQHASLDGLPFMPEMLQHCGKRYQVYRSAHKTCDTIESYSIKQMDRSVHLDLRCDGSAHDGCQASCLIFWREDWLKRVNGPAASTDSATTELSPEQQQRLQASTRVPGTGGGEDLYRCQATDLLKATRDARRRTRWNPAFYVRDLTSGNVRLRQFVWYGFLAAFNAFSMRWFGRTYPRVCGLAVRQTPTAELGLEPGELVQVRSKKEIMATLNAGQRNRGLWFDVEMLSYCDDEFRVLRRVERLVDEKTGRMIRLPTPALILDGVICSGNLAQGRMFCPRAIYPYWREVWLKRSVRRDSNPGKLRN